MPANLKHDFTGKRFGKLQILCRSKQEYKKAPKWNCLCDCGNFCVVIGQNLLLGRTRSCGCMRGDHMTKNMETPGYYK